MLDDSKDKLHIFVVVMNDQTHKSLLNVFIQRYLSVNLCSVSLL